MLGLGAGNLQRNATKTGVTDRLTSITRTFLTPVATPSRGVAVWTSDFLYGIVNARRMTAENRMYREEAAVIDLYTERISNLQSEIDELRRLHSLGPVPGHDRVVAQIKGYTIADNRLVLDVGSDKGIIAGLAVESGRGLVGIVESVERNRCTVLLIVSRQQVGAMDASRNPPHIGFMRGRDASTVEVTFQDPKAPIQVGDLIVTSGLGPHVPRNIIIGKVVQVDTSEEYGIKRAIVDPAINVGSLREVYVLK